MAKKGSGGGVPWLPWGPFISALLPIRKCPRCRKRTTWLPWCHNCGRWGWT
jgi:hypothetical protein